jgi:uncharacterized protein
MSPPWSKPLDVDRLSEAEADIAFAVPLAELPRLRSQLASVEGEVRGHVRFGRAAGIAIAEVVMSGVARLVCQRCLEAMEIPLETMARVGLIAAEADMSRVPEDLEPVLALEGRISIGELVEEELLLTLPIVPLHAETEACAVAPEAPLVADEAEETQRPFEGLGELFKRK